MSKHIFISVLLISISIDSGKCGIEEEEVFAEENNGINMTIRDLEDFPVCVIDEDCLSISTETNQDYRCFQYMCYPWNYPEMKGAFRTCQTKDDCKKLKEDEGGDGNDGECFRHPDKRKVLSGICLLQSEAEKCFENSDCSGSLVCVNGFCGERDYLIALGEQSCVDDSVCRDLLLGDFCCYDVRDLPADADHPLTKKCCDNEHGAPVITPESNVSQSQIDTVFYTSVANFSFLLV